MGVKAVYLVYHENWAGEIKIVSEFDNIEDAVQVAKQLLRNRKTVVIEPRTRKLPVFATIPQEEGDLSDLVDLG